ncbi:hypothetical protein AAE478_005699 [Parahypoxylon ruwenzoriense]
MSMATPITPITIDGRYFWKGEQRFLLNGVVYRKHTTFNGRGCIEDGYFPSDPLADDQLEDLRHSIPFFRELKLNTIFVLYIDPSKNHDAAMKLLAEAGIYVLANLSRPRRSVNHAAPFESYTAELLRTYFRAVDSIAHYDNTLGVIISHETIRDFRATTYAPVLRALTRDVKRYLALGAMMWKEGGERGVQRRATPVGISCADMPPLLKVQHDYFCAGSEEESVDFFAFDNSSWAVPSLMGTSGYDRLQAQVQLFSESPVPLFMSEYGLNVIPPRPFHETRKIYSPMMTGVFSGGIVYEFFDGFGRYGLVRKRAQEPQPRIPHPDAENRKANAGGAAAADSCLKKRKDFSSLKKSLRASFMRGPLHMLDQQSYPPWSVVYFPTSAPSPSAAEILALRRPQRPQMPQLTPHWLVGQSVPPCPLDWRIVKSQIEDCEWVDVRQVLMELDVDDVTDSMWDMLQIDDSDFN